MITIKDIIDYAYNLGKDDHDMPCPCREPDCDGFLHGDWQTLTCDTCSRTTTNPFNGLVTRMIEDLEARVGTTL